MFQAFACAGKASIIRLNAASYCGLYGRGADPHISFRIVSCSHALLSSARRAFALNMLFAAWPGIVSTFSFSNYFLRPPNTDWLRFFPIPDFHGYFRYTTNADNPRRIYCEDCGPSAERNPARCLQGTIGWRLQRTNLFGYTNPRCRPNG